jgi:peptidoglycan/LPS O-acetylase OafA/YrhL
MELATAFSSSAAQVSAVHSSRRPRIYKPELDALRFFAFLGIFFYHKLGLTHFSNSHVLALLVGFRTSLDYCVSLFFFLSSYLITMLLEVELKETQTINIKDFYIRRILRIWPLYYFFLAICIAFGYAFTQYKIPVGTILAYTFFAGNWFIAAYGWEATRPTYALLWSVCVEEQFYALCPVFVKAFRRKGLAWLSCVLLLGSYFVLFWMAAHGKFDDHLHRPNFAVQVQYFAAGTLMALLLSGRTLRIALAMRLLIVLSGLLVWFVAGYWFDYSSLIFVQHVWSLPLGYFLNLVGCILIFTGFLDVDSRYISSWMIRCGKISYGLYVYHQILITIMTDLWHIPTRSMSHLLVQTVAQIVVALAATILIAHASYKWLEKPFLILKERFTVVKSRPV